MACKLDNGSFIELGSFSVEARTRLTPGACNPSKDLLLLIHRQEQRDSVSLWKLQGTKRWEVDTVANFEQTGFLQNLAWSPDGDKLAISYDTARVTVHNVMDGCEEYRYNNPETSASKTRHPVSSLIWINLPYKRFWAPTVSKDPPPQLYPRAYDSPGSSLYLLRFLPKLDPRPPTIENPPVVDSTALRRAPRLLYPPDIGDWPSLWPNHSVASISDGPTNSSGAPSVDVTVDHWQALQANTCILGGDDDGNILPFVHGTYFTGAIEAKVTSQVTTLASGKAGVFCSRIVTSNEVTYTKIEQINGRILSDPTYRIQEMMRISTAARDLAIYASSLCEEAKNSWMGGPGKEGGRDWNIRWLKAWDQRKGSGYKSEYAELPSDLIALLLTGMPVNPILLEHLENGAQTTERMFKRWNTLVLESFIQVRNQAEGASIALQRIVALLVSLVGMSDIPHLKTDFLLEKESIETCIQNAKWAIELSLEVARNARREAIGFHHFMNWLRTLIPNLPTPDPPPTPYDTKIVANYIQHGLIPSTLDRYFNTLEPQTPQPEDKSLDLGTFKDIAITAREGLKAMRRRSNEHKLDPFFQDSSPARSILLATTVLLNNCGNLFRTIAEANTKNNLTIRGKGLQIDEGEWATLYLPDKVTNKSFREGYLLPPSAHEMLVRERLIVTEMEIEQLLFFRLVVEHPRKTKLVFARMVHSKDPPKSCSLSCAIIDCVALYSTADEEDEDIEPRLVSVNLLEAQFYNDAHLVVILQTEESPIDNGGRCIGLVNYKNLEYEDIETAGDVVHLQKLIIQRYAEGKLNSIPLPLTRSRRLPGRGEAISLSVSGERKAGCVLDHLKWMIYTFDLENDEESDVDEEESSRVIAPVDEIPDDNISMISIDSETI